MNKKLTVNSLAFGNLKMRKKQYTLMIIGIVLAMIFSSGVPFFVSCMNSSQEEARFRRQGKQDTIIVNAQNYDFTPAINQGAIDGEIGYAHVQSFVWNESEDSSDGTMVGWLDERATELYYPQIIEGRMPEKEGEIIFEKNALQRMRIEAEVGEKITLKTLTCNGAEFLGEEKDKTYTLVGIMSDKKANIENFSDTSMEKAALIPAAFVAENTQTDIGGKEALVAFLNEKYLEGSNLLWSTIDYNDKIGTSYVYRVSVGDTYYNIANNTGTMAFLAILLAFMACFGIVNAFNSNLKERKNQIGMLKAVGATRRQIINIFGREAFIICALTAPVSIGVSYGAVKLFAKLMGDNFIFKPDVTVLLIGTLFGVLCVMLSALIPLWSISKLPPMQAIRDIELMRKMKNKKIKSQKQFNVSRLLAKRKLTFSKGRQISVCGIITCAIVISCISMSFLYTTIEDTSSFYNADYEVTHNGMAGPSNTFINYENTNLPLTENSRYEILELPQVANVYGEKRLNVNIVFEDEVPEYLQINEYISYSNTSSRFITANDVANAEALSVSGSSYVSSENIKVTKENIKEFMQAATNPDYTYTKQVAGFTTEELFNATLVAKSSALFDYDESSIIDGEINLDKINSGEEIVICAPEKIGFAYEESPGGGYSYGLYNLSEELNSDDISDKEMMKNIKAEAESPFKAGDTLTLSLICSDANGNITREDRNVKIGAIIEENNISGNFSIYTTIEGLNTFNAKFDYLQFDVELKEECTAEIDEQMQAELAAMFPGKYIGSAFAFNEGEKQELRTLVLSVSSLILVFLCVCISLINNSISAQIREGKRSIGTLRAVGASEKDLVLSYIMQIASMLLWGFGTGTVLYVVSYRIIGLIVTADYWPLVLWPAFLVFGVLALVCYINLKTKIKTVTKHSIVENIRELG